MPVQKLKEFLDNNKIKYVVITHSPAFPAQQVAQSAHIPGDIMAKTLIVKLDGKMAMVVMPATIKADLDKLEDQINVGKAELASEAEFSNLFPGCELGAMPPFGNLFNMDVYVDNHLSKAKDIAFNAGSHSECIKLAYEDFARLVKPKMLS